MLIDVHAHFYTERSGRADWERVNASRLAAGDRVGITAHVASILGTYGARSPTYFPSPDDVTHGNDRMIEIQRRYPGKVFGYCVVNPNYTDHALKELAARARQGMIGLKLAASRRANDRLLDPVVSAAVGYGFPVLHHVWQHRRQEWPGQEASDAAELSQLAERHPTGWFILAHIGGGGDWAHSLRVARDCPNLMVDISGSGVDVGMLELALESVGPRRMLFGADITIDTGWAKLRYLESLGLSAEDLDLIRFGNARRIFPTGAFDRDD